MLRKSISARTIAISECVGVIALAACGNGVTSSDSRSPDIEARGRTALSTAPAVAVSAVPDFANPTATHGVGNQGSGVQAFAPTYTVRPFTAEEQAQAAALKPPAPSTVSTTAAAAPVRPTDETVTWAAGKSATEMVHLTLVLPEVPFAWDGFRGASDTDRAALVEQRQADLAPVQQPVLDKLVAANVNNAHTYWIANLIDVTVPAGMVEQLASWPELAAVEHDAPTQSQGDSGDGYYGGDRRGSIQAQRLLNQGFNGSEGEGPFPTNPVRVGDVGEYTDNGGNLNFIPNYHPGFTNSGFTRYYADDTCSATTQSCSNATTPTAQTHDTVVEGVMAGNITNGQDPNFPGSNTQAQIDRSGIAPNANLEYYRSGANNTGANVIAFQAAVAEGVDILNNSYNAAAGPTGSTDFSGINEAIQNAFNSGVLVVFSAGDNNGGTFSTTCNVGYPANRPEVIAANGLNTTYNSSGNTQASPTLGSGAWATSGCQINVYNGSTYVARNDNTIGDDTAGYVNLTYYWDSATNWGYVGPGFGTWVGSSFAAPMVAGAAGILRHAWYADGYGVRPNYWLKTDLMMLTDGYNFTSYTDGGNFRLSGGTSPYSGTGRLQMRSPDGNSFTNPSWQWTWGNGTFSPGQVYTRTIPANIQNYRLAFFWEETDLTQVADIDIFIDALNSSGQVCQSSFAFQDDYSIINAIHVKASDIPSCALPNGSLQIRFHVYAMPAGQTRQIFNSDLWDNEPGY